VKILYAASDSYSARIQLVRWLRAMQDSDHQIKIAAYKKSSPKGINIDWTLDALLNIYKPELLATNNDNLGIYYEQVKDYAPDLIISDLEYFTSYVANELATTLWQCSSSLINHALSRKEKYNLGVFKNHAHALNRDPVHTQRTINLIDNSNANLVYSHYCDVSYPPLLQKGYEWIRPYHRVAKTSLPCHHSIVAGLSVHDMQVLEILKRFSPDSVVFMESHREKYENIVVKDIAAEDEYYCNLKNSDLFICQGQASFLADAFYNGKYSLIYPNYEDAGAIINSYISRKLGLGFIMSPSEHVRDFSSFETKPIYQPSIKYLHEKIKEFSNEK
jgi:uncharacterized protein (TIGR00661 family)